MISEKRRTEREPEWAANRNFVAGVYDTDSHRTSSRISAVVKPHSGNQISSAHDRSRGTWQTNIASPPASFERFRCRRDSRGRRPNQTANDAMRACLQTANKVSGSLSELQLESGQGIAAFVIPCLALSLTLLISQRSLERRIPASLPWRRVCEGSPRRPAFPRRLCDGCLRWLSS